MPMDKKLETLIRKTFRLDGIPVDKNWTSTDIADWDSVGHLNLVVEIEKAFQVKMELDEMFEIETLGDIQKILQRKGVL